MKIVLSAISCSTSLDETSKEVEHDIALKTLLKNKILIILGQPTVHFPIFV